MRPAAFLTIVADPLPPDATYRPLPTRPVSAVRNADEATKLGGMGEIAMAHLAMVRSLDEKLR